MKPLLFLLLSLFALNTRAQSIQKRMEEYYLSSHFDFDISTIREEKIATYTKKIQQFNSDTLQHEQIHYTYYFDELGYPLRKVERNNYYGYKDSIETIYFYDSLHRLIEVRWIRPSGDYRKGNVIAERNLWHYGQHGIDLFIKMEMVHGHALGRGHGESAEQFMITQVEKIMYITDTSAKVYVNSQNTTLPDSIQSIPRFQSMEQTQEFTLNNQELSVAITTSSSHWTRKEKKCIYYDDKIISSPMHTFLTSRYTITDCIPRLLALNMRNTDSIIFTNKIRDWEEIVMDTLTTIHIPQYINLATDNRVWMELDTLNHQLLQYTIYSTMHIKSGPSELENGKITEIYDCQNNLRLTKRIRGFTTTIESGFYDLPVLHVYTIDSIGGVIQLEVQVDEPRNTITEEYSYFLCGLLHSITRKHSSQYDSRSTWYSREVYSITRH